MADRVAVLNGGRLEQFAPPSEIYDRPRTLFVNQFVGSANLLTGRLERSTGSEALIRLDTGGALACPAPSGLGVGTRVTACIRPENLALTPSGEGIAARVELGLPLGPTIVHEVVTADGLRLKIAEPRTAGAEPHPPGLAVGVRPRSMAAITVFATP